MRLEREATRIVKPTTWRDGRGVTHYAVWSANEAGVQYGWRIRCNSRLVYPNWNADGRMIGYETPTCLRCVLEDL